MQYRYKYEKRYKSLEIINMRLHFLEETERRKKSDCFKKWSKMINNNKKSWKFLLKPQSPGNLFGIIHDGLKLKIVTSRWGLINWSLTKSKKEWEFANRIMLKSAIIHGVHATLWHVMRHGFILGRLEGRLLMPTGFARVKVQKPL